MTKTYLRRAEVLIACVSVSASPLSGQSVQVPRRPATEVIANFEKMSPARIVLPDEVLNPHRYSIARVDSVEGGLERIARSAPPAVAVSAVMVLMQNDEGNYAVAPFDREMRIYQSGKVRGTIISMMPHHQKDRTRALAFLKSVAMQSGEQQDFGEAAFEAAVALSHMGKEGRTTLVQLRDRKLLRDPRAIGFANAFLKQR